MGVELPQAVDVRALAEAHGADTSRSFSWDVVCRALPDDQRSATTCGRDRSPPR